MIEAGKTYVDEHNSRRVVTAVDGNTVTYMLPITSQQQTATLDEFAEWMVGEYVDPFG